jgi:hypothetical protein
VNHLSLIAEACQQRPVRLSSYRSRSRRIILGSIPFTLLPLAQIARADDDPAFAYDTYAGKTVPAIVR